MMPPGPGPGENIRRRGSNHGSIPLISCQRLPLLRLSVGHSCGPAPTTWVAAGSLHCGIAGARGRLISPRDDVASSFPGALLAAPCPHELGHRQHPPSRNRRRQRTPPPLPNHQRSPLFAVAAGGPFPPSPPCRRRLSSRAFATNACSRHRLAVVAFNSEEEPPTPSTPSDAVASPSRLKHRRPPSPFNAVDERF